MDEFDRKVIAAFPGKSVRKDLTSLMKKGANVPTYVLEYLLGMYCATDDEDAIKTGLEKIKKILSENYVRPDQSDYVKSKIKAIPHKDCATDASSNFSSDETKSGVNT